MKYATVCSGIEAPSVAWEPIGWEPVWFSEIEPFPCAVLQHHYPNVPNRGDMTTIDTARIDRDIDILIGGTPCQSFSVAELRAGLDDPRGNLALVYLSLVDRLRPEWIIWENVPGVLSSGGGRDFGSIVGALGKLGYGWAYRVLDAQWFGVPQRRRRVFLVGHSSGLWQRAAAVLFDSESLSGNPPPRREKGEGAAGALIGGSGSGGSGYVQPVAAPLGAGDGNRGWRNDLDQGAFIPVAVQPVANTLQTTCHDYSRADGFRMVVNTRQDPIHGKVTGPLDTDGDTHAVAFRPCIGLDSQLNAHHETAGPVIKSGEGGQRDVVYYEHYTHDYCQDRVVTQYGENLAGTLTQRHDSSACADRGQNVVAFQPRVARNGRGAPEPVCPPLHHEGGATSDARPCVAYEHYTHDYCKDRVISQDGVSPALNVSQQHQIRHDYAVRRLTPIECERLQGFPDDYTAIPWRNKPAEDCPDTPRYKALGNSMATPVVRWIGERITMEEEDEG